MVYVLLQEDGEYSGCETHVLGVFDTYEAASKANDKVYTKGQYLYMYELEMNKLYNSYDTHAIVSSIGDLQREKEWEQERQRMMEIDRIEKEERLKAKEEKAKMLQEHVDSLNGWIDTHRDKMPSQVISFNIELCNDILALMDTENKFYSEKYPALRRRIEGALKTAATVRASLNVAGQQVAFDVFIGKAIALYSCCCYAK